jgi:hypothetical protein
MIKLYKVIATQIERGYVVTSKNGWLRIFYVNMPNGLMFSVKDYIVLVEDTGRIIREDKRGAISSSSQTILNRLNIPAENWLKITTEFGSLFKGAVGALPALTEYCEHLERKRRQGASNCQRWLCA